MGQFFLRWLLGFLLLGADHWCPPTLVELLAVRGVLVGDGRAALAETGRVCAARSASVWLSPALSTAT
jgi:hypothetical protein